MKGVYKLKRCNKLQKDMKKVKVVEEKKTIFQNSNFNYKSILLSVNIWETYVPPPFLNLHLSLYLPWVVSSALWLDLSLWHESCHPLNA